MRYKDEFGVWHEVEITDALAEAMLDCLLEMIAGEEANA